MTTEAQMNTGVQVFLSYAREDESRVAEIYEKLSTLGMRPWMDKRDILPGEQWRLSISTAIRRSDFVMICLSKHSVNKRGYLQREIREVLDNWQEMLDSDIYLIPIRLEDCTPPDRLRDFQWVDLFLEDGWTRLVSAIAEGAARRGRPLPGKILYDLGMEAFRRRDWPMTIKMMSILIASSPTEFPAAYYYRGYALDEVKSYRAAIADYTAYLELGATDVRPGTAYLNRGTTYLKLREADLAILDTRKALELKPNSAIAYLNLGIAYYLRSDYSESIQNYTRAIELEPIARAYFGRGQACFESGNRSMAVADFRRHLDLEAEPTLRQRSLGYLRDMGIRDTV